MRPQEAIEFADYIISLMHEYKRIEAIDDTRLAPPSSAATTCSRRRDLLKWLAEREPFFPGGYGVKTIARLCPAYDYLRPNAAIAAAKRDLARLRLIGYVISDSNDTWRYLPYHDS